MQATKESTATTTNSTSPSIRMVVQRYRKANVLIVDESKVISVGTSRDLLDDNYHNANVTTTTTTTTTMWR